MHAYLIGFNFVTAEGGFGFCNRFVALPKPPTPEQIQEYEAEIRRQHSARPIAVVALSISPLSLDD